MAGERAGHTLQPTALVHEAYARLAKEMGARWPGPREFYLAAAEAMRRILIEHARRRGAVKRGGDWTRAALDVADLASEDDCGRLVALDEAILRLEQEDPRAASIVRLRFYAGLSVDRTAEVLGVSRRTALRDWEFARAWLFGRLAPDPAGDGGAEA
jgi:RNA polymerase sigma factor (TIGR02999 family)